MPTFRPFTALRYDDPELTEGVLDLDSVIALASETHSPPSAGVPRFWAGHLVTGTDTSAQTEAQVDARVDEWIASGRLVLDPEPAFYLHRMGYTDSDGNRRQVSAAVGLVGDGPLDRLQSLPQVRFIDAPGFSELLIPSGMPLARATDSTGRHHRLWAISQAGVVATISGAVEKFASFDGAGFTFVSETTADQHDPEAVEPVIGLVFAPREFTSA